MTATGRRVVVGAIATMVVCAALLADLSEDVTSGTGPAAADADRLQTVVDHRTDVVVAVAKVATFLGSTVPLILFAVVATVLLRRRGHRRIVALLPALALLVTSNLVTVAKQAVDRARPDAALRLVPIHDAAFPSGHSADSTALFVSIAIVAVAVGWVGPRARVATVVVALVASVLVGASRVVLAAHWPTDVLAGWAIGLFMAMGAGVAAACLVARPSTP